MGLGLEPIEETKLKSLTDLKARSFGTTDEGTYSKFTRMAPQIKANDSSLVLIFDPGLDDIPAQKEFQRN
ncbi:hypothetical protein EVAR_100821_1 [Eumeta japonica]|uniref:Uncharacterized protein n=1 Tax=Eumeta variegata TaxID=151549 RepID=A0A4C2A946_EUMVA|nr:hypothetical protein EVAR_100821_1 [Eumeta japonica]